MIYSVYCNMRMFTKPLYQLKNLLSICYQLLLNKHSSMSSQLINNFAVWLIYFETSRYISNVSFCCFISQVVSRYADFISQTNCVIVQCNDDKVFLISLIGTSLPNLSCIYKIECLFTEMLPENSQYSIIWIQIDNIQLSTWKIFLVGKKRKKGEHIFKMSSTQKWDAIHVSMFSCPIQGCGRRSTTVLCSIHQ